MVDAYTCLLLQALLALRVDAFGPFGYTPSLLSRLVVVRSTEEPGGFSFAEGDEFEDEAAAIEAMGGDPFFLGNDDVEGNEDSSEESSEDKEPTITEVLSLGGDPFFLPQMEAKEEKKKENALSKTKKEEIPPREKKVTIGLGNIYNKDQEQSTVSATSILDYAQSSAKKTSDSTSIMRDLEASGGDPSFLSEDIMEGLQEKKESPSSPKKTSLSAMSILQSVNISTTVIKNEQSESLSPEDELEAMGGDPFFLGADDAEEDVPKKEKPVVPTTTSPDTESEPFEWDGIVDEDAHLDFE